MASARIYGGAEMAAAFREFDALWERPQSPERDAGMEAILCKLGDIPFDADGIANVGQGNAVQPGTCPAL